jgi:hypothetical protein
MEAYARAHMTHKSSRSAKPANLFIAALAAQMTSNDLPVTMCDIITTTFSGCSDFTKLCKIVCIL